MQRLSFILLFFLSFTTQADTPRSLVGDWWLTGITLDGRSITCPGAFVLPPGTPDIVKQFAKCGSDEVLELKVKRGKGHFHTTLTPLAAMLSPDGYWFASRISDVGDYVTFIDAAAIDAPRAYVYMQSKDRKTLTVALTMHNWDPSTGKIRSSLNQLVFERR